jgi:hypothetical protein
MNTELQAMIEAGRKLIEAQAIAKQREAAEAEAEAIQLESVHLAKLPPWMHEYVTVINWEHNVRIYLDLPGCTPMYADSVSWSDGFVQLGVANPLAVTVPGAVDRPGAALIAVAHALSQAKRPAVAVTP